MPSPAEQTPTIRLGPGPELAAAVPHLLGFPPQESLVVVALTGARTHRVGVTLRVDLPPVGQEAALAAQIVYSLRPVGPSAVVLLTFTEAPDDEPPGSVPVLPGQELLAEVEEALLLAGIEVCETLLVRSGRCWSYDDAQACSVPGPGMPLPGGTSSLAATAAFSGQVLAADRDELVRRLEPVGGADARDVAEACAAAGAEHAARLADRGREHTIAVSWRQLLDALDHHAPGSRDRLPAEQVARVGWALADIELRDQALALGLGADAAAAEALWLDLTRRLPAPLDAPAATLLAVTAWARGDGATANVALDRALGSNPDYTLAQLLRTALAAALPPPELRRLLSDAAA